GGPCLAADYDSDHRHTKKKSESHEYTPEHGADFGPAFTVTKRRRRQIKTRRSGRRVLVTKCRGKPTSYHRLVPLLATEPPAVCRKPLRWLGVGGVVLGFALYRPDQAAGSPRLDLVGHAVERAEHGSQRSEELFGGNLDSAE